MLIFRSWGKTRDQASEDKFACGIPDFNWFHKKINYILHEKGNLNF